ncbi:hypothetical protein C8J57DRAFT_974185, partial [Mycena rebaudengoi]
GVGAYWMKGDGGIFTERSREMVRDLVTSNVASKNMDSVIHTVARGLEVNLQDHISARQVGRIVEEGGIASDIQVASEIRTAEAFAASGDGTTIRNINYEAKHVTYLINGIPVTRMLDTTSAPNHTSEEQLKGWKETINCSLVDTYNASPFGAEDPIDGDEFVTFMKALGADHANDQKKLGRLANDWTTHAHKIMLGKKYLMSQELQAYLPEIARRSAAKIEAAGGLDAWNALSDVEKTKRDTEVCRDLWTHFGETQWKGLSEQERFDKEALDKKKGQQDTFKLYFEEFLGYAVACPDTSNTRFQSHCDCAIFILLHLTQILEFMSHIMYSKTNIGLNHLELNILQGLKCTSTLTELVVLAIYAIIVSYPYMRVVRGNVGGVRPNALDLGPWHAKVISFCEAVANNVDLILAPDATFKTGSLDGQPWEHPHVFYMVQRLAGGLPHL